MWPHLHLLTASDGIQSITDDRDREGLGGTGRLRWVVVPWISKIAEGLKENLSGCVLHNELLRSQRQFLVIYKLLKASEMPMISVILIEKDAATRGRGLHLVSKF